MYSLIPTAPLGPFTVDDETAEAVLDVDEDGAPIDVLTDWPDTAQGNLVSPSYDLTHPLVDLGASGDPIAVGLLQDWDEAGIWLLSVELVNDATGQVVTTDPLAIVVEAQDGWLDMSRTRALWPDARNIPDEALWLLLESAKTACVMYAPKLPEPISPAVVTPVPATYLQAQLSQARAIWNLMQTAPSADVIGIDQLTIRVYPLDYNIRQLLRPKRGVPVVH